MKTASIRTDVAPTGELRVGINYGNAVLARKDSTSGELSGVAVDLAREIGSRLDLPIRLVGFEAAGKMFEAAKAGAWDVAFLAIDPERANEIDFTAAYIEIEGTYLVPGRSSFYALEDVDQAGVRIGISAKSAYDLFLSRTIRRAELVRAVGPDAAFELLVGGKVEVVAGVRQHLVSCAAKLAGARVFDGRFMAIGQALAIQKGRPEGLKYLRSFIEEAKASGFVARALTNAGVNDVSIAPPAPIQ